MSDSTTNTRVSQQTTRMNPTTDDSDGRRITPLDEISAFQRDCMTVIAHHEGISGAGIGRELNAHYEGIIQNGRLYMALDGLVDQGLVSKGERDGRTNEYRLTRVGENKLLSHIEWQMGSHLDGGSDDE